MKRGLRWEKIPGKGGKEERGRVYVSVSGKLLSLYLSRSVTVDTIRSLPATMSLVNKFDGRSRIA